jgi:hypothetical protein
MMEAVRAFETSFYSNETTWRYILEGSHLHIPRRENVKCPIIVCLNAYPHCNVIFLLNNNEKPQLPFVSVNVSAEAYKPH